MTHQAPAFRADRIDSLLPARYEMERRKLGRVVEVAREVWGGRAREDSP